MASDSRLTGRSAGATALLLGVTLAACASAPPAETVDPRSSQGGRVAIYQSLDELIADSSLIVFGSITEQAALSGDDALGNVTASELVVDKAFAPTGLAQSLAQEGVQPSTRNPGDTVTVSQHGTPDTVTSAGALRGTEKVLALPEPNRSHRCCPTITTGYYSST